MPIVQSSKLVWIRKGKSICQAINTGFCAYRNESRAGDGYSQNKETNMGDQFQGRVPVNKIDSVQRSRRSG